MRTRYGHCIEYDTIRSQIILFGGNFGGGYLNEVWRYNSAGDSWQQDTFASTIVIDKRREHACAIYPIRNLLYVYGGYYINNPTPYFQDLWQYNLTDFTWVLLNNGIPEVGLHFNVMIYAQSLNSLLVLMGESQSGVSSSIYQFNLGNSSASWKIVTTGSQVPAGRYSMSSSFNSQTGEFIMFGGNLGNNYANDLWKIQIEPSTINSSRVLTNSKSNAVPSTVTLKTPVSASSGNTNKFLVRQSTCRYYPKHLLPQHYKNRPLLQP